MIDIQAPAFQKKSESHVGSDPLQVHVVDHALQLAEVLGGMGGISRNLLRSVRT